MLEILIWIRFLSKQATPFHHHLWILKRFVILKLNILRWAPSNRFPVIVDLFVTVLVTRIIRLEMIQWKYSICEMSINKDMCSVETQTLILHSYQEKHLLYFSCRHIEHPTKKVYLYTKTYFSSNANVLLLKKFRYTV